MSKNKPEVKDVEKQLFQAIDSNDVSLVKQLLTEINDVNILDENFMTPLQYASYRGNREIVLILLDYGADVNLCEHKHNYTALHFAGLSGNSEVCTALLSAGAKSLETNTVGRTAAQMAAFVGNHACVAVINNFVPKAEIDAFTVQNASQPFLPQFLADSFHKFIMQVNIHPVRVALSLQNVVGLRDHLGAVRAVLEVMARNEMQRGSERNEVMAFKYHYLAYIVAEVTKIKAKQDEKKDAHGDDKKPDADDKKLDPVELFARRLLRPGKDGGLDFMDGFLRECVREFPFRECTIFRQMVATLAAKDPPPALRVITSAINGQRGFVDNVAACVSCGEEKPAKKCAKCKVVQYCDRYCQRLHWSVHKKACTRWVSQTGPSDVVKPDPDELATEIQNLLVNN